MRVLLITTCASLTALGAAAPVQASDALPPVYTNTHTGDVHDFDYFAGGWTTTQRRLKTRGVGSTEWDEFPATLCMSLYLPVVGGFDGDRGEFYGEDRDNGRPVKVRYTWSKLDRDHARWEQAFAYDDRSWETNWTADFVRADTATTCEAGRPRRT